MSSSSRAGAREGEFMAEVLRYGKRDLSVILDDPYAAAAIADASPLSKRHRCAAELSHEAEPLARICALFPDLNSELIVGVLEEFAYNVDCAIKRLEEIQSGFAEKEANSSARERISENLIMDNLPTDGAGWVELLVRQVTSASCIDDARACVSRVLELLEKSIVSRANDEAAKGFQKETEMLNEKMEGLVQETTVLKRGIAYLLDRQKDYEARIQENEQLKQTISQYDEKMKMLELNNYALAMHLKQAQRNSSIPGCFHPDVF